MQVLGTQIYLESWIRDPGFGLGSPSLAKPVKNLVWVYLYFMYGYIYIKYYLDYCLVLQDECYYSAPYSQIFLSWSDELIYTVHT